MSDPFTASGYWAKLADSVLSFFVDENKLPEIRKRRQLAALRKDAKDALDRNDWVEHRRILAELERLSDQP